METNEKYYCQGCDEIVVKLYSENFASGLCKECDSKFFDKSGYCSLSCCLGEGCDEDC